MVGDASEVEELKFADPISEDVGDGVGCAGALYGEGRYVWFDDVDVVASFSANGAYPQQHIGVSY